MQITTTTKTAHTKHTQDKEQEQMQRTDVVHGDAKRKKLKTLTPTNIKRKTAFDY